jgi:epoxyqueuosine reductase
MRHLSQIKQTLKAEAFKLGFSHFGVSPVKPVPYLHAFHAWIGAGCHADMYYLERADTLAKRGDPGLILEGCQRVISLAMSYQAPNTPPNKIRPGFGRISAYARTTDYHEVIQDKLNILESVILNTMGDPARVKSYVDTGPVLERAFTMQAGLGMPGKNTNLIIPGTGSYVILAVILTNLELPYDAPFTRNLCGSCQRCIEACPTRCILPNRTIDASRCISYLTIENKHTIPDGLKKQVGSWLFGCDICQMVCPHNARAHNQPSSIGQPQLAEFIELTEMIPWGQDEFAEAFNATALTRAKLSGIIRNAAIVLGNQGYKKALPNLKNRLAHETDPVIQDSLQWAINQIEQHG